MAPRGRALVLDGDRVHALDIVRSLGNARIAVSVGAARPDAIAFRSRFAKQCELYPDPTRDAARFVDWLERRLRESPCDLVIPVTDVTGIPISRNFDRLRPLSALATEAFDKLQLVSDKSMTLDVARRVGVPFPTTVTVYDEADLDREASRLAFPVVCKPVASSVWSDRGYSALSVFYALNEQELRREVGRRLADSPIMLQEYRKGTGVGIEVLARDGELLQVFQHERLHEVPLTGGGSTYRMSVPVDPLLREYAARLLGAIGWTGVAMVEFRVDRAAGDVALMEINGRFWGSLALSSRAGMSFPADLFDMLALHTTPAPRTYVSGVRCRKLRDDLEWFKLAWRLDAGHPYVAAGMVRKPGLGREIGRLLSLTDRYDVQLLSDPVPGLRDLVDTARAHLGGVTRGVRQLVNRARLGAHRRGRRAHLVKRVSTARRLLFICYGNIMRSPFASAYLHSRTAGRGLSLEITSAGLYERTGRTADPRAIAAGRAWGVDLVPHRSKTLDDRLVRWADLILVMDCANFDQIQKRFPGAATKTYLLGSLDAGVASEVEIPDPFNDAYEATECAYGRIARAVDRLVQYHDAQRCPS